MEVDDLIEAAIAEGMRNGVGSLSTVMRAVFLISEAEVLCDMEGIDSFLRQYAPAWTNETAEAYSNIGATDIAEGFREISSTPAPSEQLLDRVNKLVTGRVGYRYSDIARFASGGSVRE